MNVKRLLTFLLFAFAVTNCIFTFLEIPVWITATVYWLLVSVYWGKSIAETEEQKDD